MSPSILTMAFLIMLFIAHMLMFIYCISAQGRMPAIMWLAWALTLILGVLYLCHSFLPLMSSG